MIDKLQKIIRERLVKWRHDKGRFLFHMSSTVQRYKYICKEDGNMRSTYNKAKEELMEGFC